MVNFRCLFRAMLLPSRDELTQAIACAATYRPKTLKKRILVFLRALVFQHDCLMVEAYRLGDDINTSEAQGSAPEILSNALAIHEDLTMLVDLIQRLDQLDDSYEKADNAVVQAVADQLLSQCTDDNYAGNNHTGELRSKLEQIYRNSQDHLLD